MFLCDMTPFGLWVRTVSSLDFTVACPAMIHLSLQVTVRRHTRGRLAFSLNDI